MLDGLIESVVRVKGAEVPQHDALDWNPSERGVHLRQGGFLLGAHPNEQCDENQERVFKEAHEPEDVSKSLADPRGIVRRLRIVHASGK